MKIDRDWFRQANADGLEEIDDRDKYDQLNFIAQLDEYDWVDAEYVGDGFTTVGDTTPDDELNDRLEQAAQVLIDEIRSSSVDGFEMVGEKAYDVAGNNAAIIASDKQVEQAIRAIVGGDMRMSIKEIDDDR